jgi:hypothetical protein
MGNKQFIEEEFTRVITSLNLQSTTNNKTKTSPYGLVFKLVEMAGIEPACNKNF